MHPSECVLTSKVHPVCVNHALQHVSAAHAGGARVAVGAMRVVIGGWMAMLATFGIGGLLADLSSKCVAPGAVTKRDQYVFGCPGI